MKQDAGRACRRGEVEPHDGQQSLKEKRRQHGNSLIVEQPKISNQDASFPTLPHCSLEFVDPNCQCKSVSHTEISVGSSWESEGIGSASK